MLYELSGLGVSLKNIDPKTSPLNHLICIREGIVIYHQFFVCFPASLINNENLTIAILQSLLNLIKFKFLRRFHTILKDRVPRTPSYLN